MSESERTFQKSLDYATVCADGIIFELGHEVSRLIFYQKELEINEDGTAIDKKRKVITLKFEVRLPHEALERLSENAQNMFKLSNEVFYAMKDTDDTKVKQVWYRFQTNLQRIVYDTHDLKPDYEGELGEDANELLGRLQRKK